MVFNNVNIKADISLGLQTACRLGNHLSFSKTSLYLFPLLSRHLARNYRCTIRCGTLGFPTGLTDLRAAGFHPVHPVGEVICERNELGTDRIMEWRPTWSRAGTTITRENKDWCWVRIWLEKKKTAKQMEMVEIISMTHVSFFILKREADKSWTIT